MANLTIVKDRILKKLDLVYEIIVPEPEELELTDYQRTAYPAIISNIMELSISHVIPRYKMGRVLSFDVYPRYSPDPYLIFSLSGDLKPYYKIWREVVLNGSGFFIGNTIKRYHETIRHFIETSDLDKNEICFAVIEMLKFQNEIIMTRGVL